MALFGRIASAFVEVESKPDSRFKSRIEGAAQGAGRSAGRKGGRSMGGAMAGAAGAALKTGLFAGAAAAGAGAFFAIKTGIQEASARQQAIISFDTLLPGGEDVAKRFMGELEEFAARTPFRLPQLREAATQMIGVGRSAEESLVGLERWGDTAAALGLENEQLSRVLVAVNQISAKGTVSMEELRQIQEAGIPITNTLAEAMGVSSDKIIEMVSSGEMAADDVLPKLEKQLGKDYGGSMAKQAETLGGRWSTLLDTFTMGMSDVIQPLIPMLTSGMGSAITVVGDATEGLTAIVEQGVEWWRQMFGTVRSGSAVIAPDGPLGTALRELRALWNEIWPQLRSIVVGVVDVVSNVIRVATALWEGVWARHGEQLMAVAGRIWQAIKATIKAALVIIQGIIDVFAGLLTADWGRVWEGIKGIVVGAWQFIQAAVRNAVALMQGVLRIGLGIVQTIWSNAWGAVRDEVVGFLRRIGTWISDKTAEFVQTIRVWRFVFGLVWQNALDDIWDRVRGWGRDLVAWFKGLPERIIEAVGDLGEKITDAWSDIKVNVASAFGFGDGLGIGAKPGDGSGSLMGVSPMSAVGRAYTQLGRPGSVTSGFRPGSRTLSGALSYHARGQALDITPVAQIAHMIRNFFGGRTKELITPWPHLNLWHGRPHTYSAGVQAQHSGANAHIHWAMGKGAFFDKRTFMPGGGLFGDTGPEVVSPVDMMAKTFRDVLREGGGSPLIGQVNIAALDERRAASAVRDELAHADLLRAVTT